MASFSTIIVTRLMTSILTGSKTRASYIGIMSDEEDNKNLPEEFTSEEIPELDPEVIPTDEPPYGDFDHRPLGASGLFKMNLNCCGCSGTTVVLIVLAIVLLLYLWKRSGG
jgi:hypothetical protein